jgi:hypothetical protein
MEKRGITNSASSSRRVIPFRRRQAPPQTNTMTEEETQQQQATKAEVEGETADVEMSEAALIEASGGRARRSTQKFGFDDHKPEEEEEAFTPPVGDGVKVRDMEAIAEKVQIANMALCQRDEESLVNHLPTT